MKDLIELGFSVEVKDFCNYCPDFEVEHRQANCTTYGDVANGVKKCLNVISCVNMQKCLRLKGNTEL